MEKRWKEKNHMFIKNVVIQVTHLLQFLVTDRVFQLKLNDQMFFHETKIDF